jgi:DNA-directed RNA polymerase subunit RPC12/RpoP
MPIRFRCAYCNQLMGISRRKAGTVVRCPSCSGQVVVPNPSAEPTERPHEPPPPKPGPQPHLFERSNFEELFDDAAGGKRAPARPVAAAAPHRTPDQPQAIGPVQAPVPAARRSEPSGPVVEEAPHSPELAFDVEPVPFAPAAAAPAARPGITLSPRTATLAIVGVILALAMAFAVGLVVGMLLHAPTETSGPSSKEASRPALIHLAEAR